MTPARAPIKATAHKCESKQTADFCLLEAGVGPAERARHRVSH